MESVKRMLLSGLQSPLIVSINSSGSWPASTTDTDIPHSSVRMRTFPPCSSTTYHQEFKSNSIGWGEIIMMKVRYCYRYEFSLSRFQDLKFLFPAVRNGSSQRHFRQRSLPTEHLIRVTGSSFRLHRLATVHQESLIAG